MTQPDNRGVDAGSARARFVDIYRLGQWMAVAVVAIGSVWSDPTLTADLVFIGLIGSLVIGVLIVGRTPLVVSDERSRLLLDQVIVIALLTAVIVVAGPPARTLSFVFALPVALAPWLVGIRQARNVLASALLGSVVVAAAAWSTNGRVVLVDVGAALFVFGVLHFVMVELAQLFAGVRRRLVSLSDFDRLTGAYNLEAFLMLGAQMHEQAIAQRQPYAILVVDIDDLKAINDRHGHGAGSRAIELVAAAIERLRNADELMARYDGDKLALILPRLEGARAAELAQRIRNAVFATTLNVDTQVVRIKANVGVARYPVDGTTLDALLSKAETDMRIDQAGREPPKNKPVFKRRSGTKPA